MPPGPGTGTVPKFPSAEWAEALRTALNANAEYARAAAAWEGDFLLVILPEPGLPEGVAVHLDLHHGSCRSATYVERPASVSSEFTVSGTRANWERLLNGAIEPIPSLMNGTLKLQGNPMKALRFSKAAQEMLKTAASVPRTA